MSVSLNSGDLNRRIRIEQRAVQRDTVGQLASPWDPVVTCWARIDQLSGRELVMAQAIHAETTHRIRIRYRPGITAAMRAVYGDRQFNVLGVTDPETAHVALDLFCSEGLADDDSNVFRAISA